MPDVDLHKPLSDAEGGVALNPAFPTGTDSEDSQQPLPFMIPSSPQRSSPQRSASHSSLPEGFAREQSLLATDGTVITSAMTFAQPGTPQHVLARPDLSAKASLRLELESRNRGAGIWLRDLPFDLREILVRYDKNQDGFLDSDEMLQAREDMEQMQQLVQTGRLPMSSFPDNKRRMLKKHDVNMDGEIDVVEILHGFEALHREKRRQKQLMYFSCSLVTAAIVLLLGMSGMLAYVIHLLKDTEIKDSRMYSKDSVNVVRTAGTDYTVQNGVLINRRSDDCVEQCERPLKAAQLSDQDLQELRFVTIQHMDSFIRFKVGAIARYADENSKFGSKVVLYTKLGELTLDGEILSFHESLEGAFERAGFEVFKGGSTGSHRRLLGVVQTVGMFNFLQTVLGAEGPSTALQQEESIARAEPFRAHVTSILYCDEAGAKRCFLDDGSLVDWVGSDAGKDALIWTEEQAALNISGVMRAKTIKTSAQYPEVEEHEVHNGTHRIKFLKHENQLYHCSVQRDSSLMVAFGIVEDEDTQSSRVQRPTDPDAFRVENLGTKSINGVACQHYRVSDTSDNSVDYYEHLDDGHRLYQISWGQMAWRFDSLTFDPAAGEPDEFEFDAILRVCDPLDTEAPPTWGAVNRNAVRPHPSWGGPAWANHWEPGSRESTAIHVALTKGQAEGLQRRISDDYCPQTNSTGNLGDSGGTFSYTAWGACSGERRSSQAAFEVLQVSLDGAWYKEDSNGDPQICMSTAGAITVYRESLGTIYTTGGYTVTVDAYNCFWDEMSRAQRLVVQRNVQDTTSSAHYDLSLQSAAGMRSFWEAVTECAAGASAQMGRMADAFMFNSTMDQQFDNAFYNAGGDPIFVLNSNLRMRFLLLSNDNCGYCQEDETTFAGPGTGNGPQTLGFRVALKWSGLLNWNMCDNGRGNTPRYKPCVEANTAWSPTQWTPSTHSLFPGTDGAHGNCETQSIAGTDVYRYQCRCPATTWDAPDCSWCEDGPIGIIKVDGTACLDPPISTGPCP